MSCTEVGVTPRGDAQESQSQVARSQPLSRAPYAPVLPYLTDRRGACAWGGAQPPPHVPRAPPRPRAHGHVPKAVCPGLAPRKRHPLNRSLAPLLHDTTMIHAIDLTPSPFPFRSRAPIFTVALLCPPPLGRYASWRQRRPRRCRSCRQRPP